MRNFYRNRPLILIALPALLFVVGCGKDKPDSYPLTGKDGAPLTASEARAIADAHSSDPKKPPMTKEEIANKVAQSEKDRKQRKETPSETQVGIPFIRARSRAKIKATCR